MSHSSTPSSEEGACPSLLHTDPTTPPDPHPAALGSLYHLNSGWKFGAGFVGFLFNMSYIGSFGSLSLVSSAGVAVLTKISSFSPGSLLISSHANERLFLTAVCCINTSLLSYQPNVVLISLPCSPLNLEVSPSTESGYNFGI